MAMVLEGEGINLVGDSIWLSDGWGGVGRERVAASRVQSGRVAEHTQAG